MVIATPPSTHAPLSLDALAAGRHVFCEKPLALTVAEAETVRDAAVASGRTFVVDHVLRYNPVLAALRRLHEAGVLGAVQRFAFENDAADEDLPCGHWFWDDAVSGGILLEHGVHFFDAAAMLIGAPARRVQAIGTTRADGRTDTVVCTVAHAGGALATHAHGFSHAHRAERQLMRLDYGLAEARVHGWIPLRAELDIWTDRVDAFERIADDGGDLLAVPGIPASGHERVDVRVERDVAPADTRARGVPRRAPHHVTVRIDLGGPERKQAVYRDSVAAALLDLARCAQTGSDPSGRRRRRPPRRPGRRRGRRSAPRRAHPPPTRLGATMTRRRLTAAIAGLLAAAGLLAVPAASGATRAADRSGAGRTDQPGPSGLPHRHRHPAGPAGAHDLPSRHRTEPRGAVGVRQPPVRRQLPTHRWRHVRPGHEHVRAGRPTTRTTSPAPPWCTCGTGPSGVTSTAATRPTSCCAG